MTSINLLSPEEREYPYAKYFFRNMPDISSEQMDALYGDSLTEDEMLHIEDRQRLLEGIPEGHDIGYGIFENGTGYAAAVTQMPYVSPEAFYWWFAWHGLEDLRYRIWYPSRHFYARTQNKEQALDESKDMCERIWDTTHLICEDVVAGAEEIMLDFLHPSKMGYDESKLGSDGACAMVCANGHTKIPGEGLNCVMTHVLRKGKSGFEVRSQFWIGYQIIDGKVFKVIPDEVSIPLDSAKALYKHCCEEFTNLATFLPMLHAEMKDSPFL